ncbi:hypothetical protein AD940_13655 [Gluconobacter thailandicus]|uniref:hypothetical protein n=1 Tax=Gluconobacter thailandicus TaxID=257438 RepID=UPI000777F06E|nr:hypothetical protein [Gluconobacter thailandicus]KXV32995.1 hypothetical protein AD940_13655 [Gluconobacter thailandicus]
MGARRSSPPALPFEDLPHRRVTRTSPSREARTPSPTHSQPDLLDWQPPQTHLSAEDIDAQVLEAVGFRPASGGAFLYAVLDLAYARIIVEHGLPFEDRLVFLEAKAAVNVLAELPPEQETGILRVRRRLIQFWLETHRDGDKSCYVLVAKQPSEG